MCAMYHVTINYPVASSETPHVSRCTVTHNRKYIIYARQSSAGPQLDNSDTHLSLRYCASLPTLQRSSTRHSSQGSIHNTPREKHRSPSACACACACCRKGRACLELVTCAEPPRRPTPSHTALPNSVTSPSRPDGRAALSWRVPARSSAPAAGEACAGWCASGGPPRRSPTPPA